MWTEILKRFCGDSEYRRYFCVYVDNWRQKMLTKFSALSFIILMMMVFTMTNALFGLVLCLTGDIAIGLSAVVIALAVLLLALRMSDFLTVLINADKYAQRWTWR